METPINELSNLRRKMIPVLRVRVHELKKLGIYHIREQDIWNYLVYTKWKNAKDLTLAEMANDILSLDV